MDDPFLSRDAGENDGHGLDQGERTAAMNLDEAFKVLGWGSDDWPSTEVPAQAQPPQPAAPSEERPLDQHQRSSR